MNFNSAESKSSQQAWNTGITLLILGDIPRAMSQALSLKSVGCANRESFKQKVRGRSISRSASL